VPSHCRTTIHFGSVYTSAVIDSGADITVVRPKYLPLFSTNSPDVCPIKLISAFGDDQIATLTNVQCALVNDDLNVPMIVLQVAVSDKLKEACLRSLSDYRHLSEVRLTGVPNGAKYKKLGLYSPSDEELSTGLRNL